MSYGKIFQWKKEGDMGIVTFDVVGEAMNTWTQPAIDEFLALLADLENTTDVRGVIFVSGKAKNFHAGANLNVLDKMVDKPETTKTLDVYHNAFQRLSALPYPTLAAIEGQCLGGGLEFALACTARIALISSSSQG